MLLCMTADELKQKLAAVRSQGFRRYPRELREQALRYVQLHAGRVWLRWAEVAA